MREVPPSNRPADAVGRSAVASRFPSERRRSVYLARGTPLLPRTCLQRVARLSAPARIFGPGRPPRPVQQLAPSPPCTVLLPQRPPPPRARLLRVLADWLPRQPSGPAPATVKLGRRSLSRASQPPAAPPSRLVGGQHLTAGAVSSVQSLNSNDQGYQHHQIADRADDRICKLHRHHTRASTPSHERGCGGPGLGLTLKRPPECSASCSS
jgi:hypothetical protein